MHTDHAHARRQYWIGNIQDTTARLTLAEQCRRLDGRTGERPAFVIIITIQKNTTLWLKASKLGPTATFNLRKYLVDHDVWNAIAYVQFQASGCVCR
jgi:hypothetical protein